MSRVLIVGDSQSGNPGLVAQRKLEAMGHTVQKIENDGKGPYDYVRLSDLWNSYINTVHTFNPDVILLIFGHNDAPNANLQNALVRLKQSVRPKVLLSGPPQYADPAEQAIGEQVKTIHQQVFGGDFLDAYPYTSTSLPHQPPTATFPINPHFTLDGAQPWGSYMAEQVQQRLQHPLVRGHV